jgi:hypothetical protein
MNQVLLHLIIVETKVGEPADGEARKGAVRLEVAMGMWACGHIESRGESLDFAPTRQDQFAFHSVKHDIT